MPSSALFSESCTSSPKSIRRFAFRVLFLGILIVGFCGPGSLDAQAQPDWLLQNEPIVTSTPEPTPEPNIPPMVKSWSFETSVGITVSTPLDASDANEDRLTYQIVDKPQNGVISGIAPDLIYTPEANYVGIDSFTFKVNDGEFDSAIGTVTIEVLPADTNTSQGVDAQISVLNGGNFIGDGIYNRSGRGQTLEREFKANSGASYEVRIQNEAGKAQPLKVKATPTLQGWSLHYFDAPTGGKDITPQITSKLGWQTPSVATNGSLAIRVEVVPTLGAAENQDITITLTDEIGGDVVKVQGYCPQPYCPDAMIEITEDPVWESYDLGDDIYLPDGDNPNLQRYNAYFEAQTNRQFVGSGLTATYYVYAQNDGRVTDQLRIKALGGSDGWVVRYFNEYGNNEDITAALTGAGWTTPDLKPSEDWGIRVEVTSGDNKFGTSFPVAVQVDSVGAGFYPELRDVVTADTVCEHLTNDLVIYPLDENGKVAADGVGNRILNVDARRQTVTQNSFVLNPVSALVGSRVSHVGATYLYMAPAGDADWLVRYFYGSKDITDEITGGGWKHEVTDNIVLWATGINNYQVTLYDPIRIQVTPLTTATASINKELLIQSTAVHETKSFDTVKFIIHREPTLDLSIKPNYEVDYEGVGVFNADARNQTVGFSQTKGKGIAPIFDIRIANHSALADTYILKAPARSEGWTLHFYDAPINGKSIAAEITSTKGWTTPELAPGASFKIRLESTPDTTGSGNSIGGSLVTATSVRNKTATDAVKATFGLQVIKKIQYSINQGKTWVDAPEADSGEYVPGIAKRTIGFRAVPVDPSLPWPFIPSIKPLWDDSGYWNLGETIWVGGDEAGEERLISAECGNVVKTRLRVYEWYKVSLDASKTYIALNGGNEGQVTLTAEVKKSNGKPAPGMTVRFTANFENGKTAGKIGEGNTDDDRAVTDANGNVSVTLFTGKEEGYVELHAYVVERGRDTDASATGGCVFGLPTTEEPVKDEDF